MSNLVTPGKHHLCNIKAPCPSGHGWTGAAVSEDHGGVSCPWSDVHSSYSQGTAALCDVCVCVHPLVTECKSCVWRPLGGRWSELWAVRAAPSSCASAMSGDSWRKVQGCCTSSWTCSPCGVPVPDGHSCVKCLGLVYEPLLLTERLVWICDFVCGLLMSYLISQSWSLSM